jgi:hypothetical protein
LHHADPEQHRKRVGESRGDREHTDPQNGELQHADAPDPVSKNPRTPPADGDAKKRRGSQITHLRMSQPERRDQRWNHQREDRGVHRIEAKPGETSPISAPLDRREIRVPTQTHFFLANTVKSQLVLWSGSGRRMTVGLRSGWADDFSGMPVPRARRWIGQLRRV